MKKQVFVKVNRMIILDKSIDKKILDYIYKLNLETKFLSDINSFFNGGNYYVVLVNEENLDLVHQKITSPKDIFVFIISSKSISSDQVQDIDNFLVFNPRCSEEIIKRQLDLFFKKSEVLKKVQFQLNENFKNELLERSTFLGQIESKLAEVHQNLVPLRKVKTSNMTLFSKYALGSNVGGEFVDFEKTNDCLFLIMFSTNSYVLSGDLVELVLTLRKNKEFNYSNFVNKIGNFQKARKQSFDFFAAEINYKNLSVNVSSRNYKVIQNKELVITGAVQNVEILLQASDQLFIESPGLGNYLTEGDIRLDRISQSEAAEIFNHVFSYVRSSITSGLGGPDATLAMLEVQKNAFKSI